MKLPELIRVGLVAIVAGGAAFLLTRQLSPEAEAVDEVSWLIEEFSLSAQQADQVRELHAAYRPICDAHCAEIMAVQQVVEDASNIEEKALATQNLELLKTRCHSATQDHIKAVAAVMSAEQGQRYLKRIMPLLSAHDHDEPLGLR